MANSTWVAYFTGSNVTDDARTRPPADRGTLHIADHVVELIAGRAALEVDRVVATGGRLDQVVGHRYPRVSTTIAGQRVRVGVKVALTWPAPVAAVVQDVREVVRTRLAEMTGMQIDTVDVTVAEFAAADMAPTRRVL